MSDIYDIDKIKRLISCLAYSEHMGDVNDVIPHLCEALRLPAPTWEDDSHGAGGLYRMGWDDPE